MPTPGVNRQCLGFPTNGSYPQPWAGLRVLLRDAALAAECSAGRGSARSASQQRPDPATPDRVVQTAGRRMDSGAAGAPYGLGVVSRNRTKPSASKLRMRMSSAPTIVPLS